MSMTEEENRELKNSIFAARNAAEGGSSGGIPTQTMHQAAKQDLGFELGQNIVPLPSRGLVYSEGPLHMAETIDIKAMTAREEDILMNRSLVRKGTVMEKRS